MDTPSDKKPAPTKLLLLTHQFNLSGEITSRLTTLPVLNRLLDYKYEFEMPSVMAVPNEEEYEKISFWSKQPVKKTRIRGYAHYLAFSKALSEKELELWRWFKLGYLCKYYRPETQSD
jgi:hypothetical protein